MVVVVAKLSRGVEGIRTHFLAVFVHTFTQKLRFFNSRTLLCGCATSTSDIPAWHRATAAGELSRNLLATPSDISVP